MNNADIQYQQLLDKIIKWGTFKEDRTGTGCISIFGEQLRFDMSEGFPILTTKKVLFDKVKSELFWFLDGSTDIRDLWKRDNHIWDGDWYKAYSNNVSSPYSIEEMQGRMLEDPYLDSSVWELGPIYGHQWRKTGGSCRSNCNKENRASTTRGIDQIQRMVNLLKADPDSRRMYVNAWNVEDLSMMTLPPCHTGFQLYTRKTTREEKIVNPGKYRALSLRWEQRSVDTFLGLPFNIASYALLLHMFAAEANMVPDQLIGQLGDVHLYSNHLEQAKEQILRQPRELPQIKGVTGIKSVYEDIVLEGYDPHPYIKAPLSN